MKTIAVIFGGKSAEHDVSIITAHIPIIDALRAAGGYDIWPIYITKEGRWYSDKAMNDLSFFQDPSYEEKLTRLKSVSISFENGFTIEWGGIFKKSVRIDVVFPAMHGTYGEDGSLMGVLRMARVPFVGCDLFASAVAMDKVLAKQVISSEGIPVVPHVWFTKTDWEHDAERFRKRIEQELSYPLFVKPAHLGSSIGITKAQNAAELENAIEVALHYDDKVLVENGVGNLIEVTLPIWGNENPKPACVERPLNKSELFSYEDKYLRGGKKGSNAGVNSRYSEVPADIGADRTKKVIDIGLAVYKTLGCSGIARVDFLIDDKADRVYVNEVNTLPGSLYHHNWKKAGVSSTELVVGLVKLAEERQQSLKDTEFTFRSDILQKVRGAKNQQHEK